MMMKNVRRFARQVLLAHLIILLIVITLVVIAARSVYDNARAEVVSRAQDRQELLATETVNGISAYYRSILSEMDSLNRNQDAVVNSVTSAPSDTTNADAAAINPAQPPANQPQPNQPQPNQSQFTPPAPPPDGPEGERPRADGFGPGGPLAGDGPIRDALRRRGVPLDPRLLQVVWRELHGRISHLAAIDRSNGHILASFNDLGFGPMSELSAADVSWARQIKGPSVSHFVMLGTNQGNLVVIPSTYGRYTYIAFVPVTYVKASFFDSINRRDTTAAILLDDDGTCMVADDAQMSGQTIPNLKDGPNGDFWNALLTDHTNTSAVLTNSVAFGPLTLPPRVMSGTMVPGIPGSHWVVIMTTPLADIGKLVDSIFSGVLFWAIVLVVAMTAILVSTAIQAIRARAGVERDRAALLDRELKEARQIQLAWLPDVHTELTDLRVAAANVPASHISGDFYNWFELSDNRTAVLIGDVTGHGMSAAFLMSTTQLLLRALLLQTNDIGRALTTANRLLCAQAFHGQFVTVAVMIIDAEKSVMEICSAGHQPPLVDDGTGEGFAPLPLETQLVLGVDRTVHYTPTQFAIRAGSTMLLYTDGAVECRNDAGTQLTTGGLCDRLRAPYPTPQHLIDQILREVTSHAAGEFDDDVTLVALRLNRTGRSEAGMETVSSEREVD